MDEKDLRSIIEQVLTEMNVSGAKPAEKAAAACACESAPEVEDGCIPTSRRSTSASSIW